MTTATAVEEKKAQDPQQKAIEEIMKNHDSVVEFEMKKAGQRILKVLELVKEGDWSFEDGQAEIKKIAQELTGE